MGTWGCGLLETLGLLMTVIDSAVDLLPGVLVWSLGVQVCLLCFFSVKSSLACRPLFLRPWGQVWVLGSSLEVLGFLSVALGFAFSPGFLRCLALCADWLLVPWSLMVSLSLASGFSESPDGFPPAVWGVFSRSLPAPLGSGWELSSLLELLRSCCEEPTSPREVLDSLGILSLVLSLDGWGEGVLVWGEGSLAAWWPVFPSVFSAAPWPW